MCGYTRQGYSFGHWGTYWTNNDVPVGVELCSFKCDIAFIGYKLKKEKAHEERMRIKSLTSTAKFYLDKVEEPARKINSVLEQDSKEVSVKIRRRLPEVLQTHLPQFLELISTLDYTKVPFLSENQELLSRIYHSVKSLSQCVNDIIDSDLKREGGIVLYLESRHLWPDMLEMRLNCLKFKSYYERLIEKGDIVIIAPVEPETNK